MPLLCQTVLIFPVVRLTAVAGHHKPEQHAATLLPLSDALPLYQHHLMPFPLRAVSRFLLSQKQDSCFDNGYSVSHQTQEASKKRGGLQKQELTPEKLSVPGAREFFFFFSSQASLVCWKQPPCQTMLTSKKVIPV